MDLKHPEVKFLATRVYGLELLIRGMCQRDPTLREYLEGFVKLHEDLALNSRLPDDMSDAIHAVARRVISLKPRQP